jgi:hypothetical protein
MYGSKNHLTTVPLKGRKKQTRGQHTPDPTKTILKIYIIRGYSLLPESRLLELEPYRDILERSLIIINNK